MKKIFLICSLIQLLAFSSFSQHTNINYGNNPSAGRFYDIRGFKMYCEIYGTGTPLLMIHGNGGNIKSFQQNIAYFAKKYKVIVADSRAQGKSKDTGDSLSFEMMADDEAALMDSLHIRAAYIIGWSDGGINALLLAMKYPKKVIKFAASGANLWTDSTTETSSAWRKDKLTYNLYSNKIIASLAEKNQRKLFMLDWLQPKIEPASLDAIKCAALIISGDHDVISLEHTALIYENIPHAYLWVIPNSGHGTIAEHKDEFNRKVDAFFSDSFKR